MAHIAVIERRVTVGKRSIPVTVAGLQCVFVRPPWRKTGLSDRIMGVVVEESRRRGLDTGLLFCLPVLEHKVYGRLGWKRNDVRVLASNDSGAKIPIPEKNIAMIIPITRKNFPEGDIDLEGPDW